MDRPLDEVISDRQVFQACRQSLSVVPTDQVPLQRRSHRGGRGRRPSQYPREDSRKVFIISYMPACSRSSLGSC